MTARYQPTLYVAGIRVAGTTPDAGLLALADIEIKWGRADLYAKTPPATCKVSFIDADGAWSTNNAVIGTELRIDRDPGVTQFRGTIGEVTIADFDLAGPDGKTTRVYLVSILATDVLATLASAVVPGNSLAAGAAVVVSTSIYGPDCWPSRSYINRAADLMAGGPQGGLSRYVKSMETAPAGVFSRRAISFSEQLSLLDLVERYYASVPLAYVNYDPTSEAITIGQTAPSTGLALTLVASKITISPVAGYVIAADSVIVPKNVAIKSTVTAAIDSVNLNTWFNGATYQTADGTNYYVSAEYPNRETVVSALTSNRRGSRTFTVDTDYRSGPNSANVDEAQIVANAIAAAIDGVNNQFEMPPLTIDFRRFTSGTPALDALLLGVSAARMPLYFAGSRFNHLPNIGPQFQYIGGTIKWIPRDRGSELDAGWSVEMTLAPTAGKIANLTLAQIITNPTPTLADFDPSISLSDLGNVSIGLA